MGQRRKQLGKALTLGNQDDEAYTPTQEEIERAVTQWEEDAPEGFKLMPLAQPPNLIDEIIREGV